MNIVFFLSMPQKRKKTLREPKLHKVADKLSEILIYFMVIFSPWAFGSTEPWSVWTMNISAFGLGILLITKLTTRRFTNFSLKHINLKNNKICNFLLAISVVLLFIYILTSAINARATFNIETKEYTYFPGFNPQLPHTYNSKATWFLFWQYFSLSLLFFSTKDWITGAFNNKGNYVINPRIKRLLFIICLNGGALGMECVIQRMHYGDGIGKLLFLVEPNINSPNISQFGPFAYRSNASSYLNLIWPIGIGLFAQLSEKNLSLKNQRLGQGPELILIPCIIIVAIGPIISTARGGTLVMIGITILIALSFIFSNMKSKFVRLSVPILLISSLAAAYILGWEQTKSRITDFTIDNMSGRNLIYDATFKMIEEYGIFGSGPGTFETVAHFEMGDYRDPDVSMYVDYQWWESWAHNDYLELYLTFGKIGFTILSAIGILFMISIIISIFNGPLKYLKLCAIISLLGVMIHAIADFPLQTYSILIMIMIIGAILTAEPTKIKNYN